MNGDRPDPAPRKSGPLDREGPSDPPVGSGIDLEIANLYGIINGLRRQIEIREGQIEKLKAVREMLVGGSGADAVADRSEVEQSATKRPRQPRPGSQVEMIAKQAKRILLREGRALTRTELLELLQAEGIKVEADNPSKRVGKVLWSQPEFEHVGVGYWLTGIPLPSKAGE